MILQIPSRMLSDPKSVGMCLIGVLIAYFLLDLLLDPGRHIPGPFVTCFTRLWNVSRVYRGDYEVTAHALHEKYGALVRVQPGQYITNDVATARAMLQVSGPVWLKDRWHDAWSPPPPTPSGLFSDRDHKRHAAQRKKVSSLYSMTSIKGYESFVDETINVLKARFNKAAESQETIDLAVLLQSDAFDVVSCITFGHSFGALDETKDSSSLFKAIDQRVAYSTFAGFFPFIHPYVYPQVVKRTAGSFVYKFCFSHIASIRDALRLGKAKSPINAQPFIARLIEKQNDAPEQITSGDIYATALSNIFAGSDTTATSLCGVLYHLIRTPRVLAKLRQELTEARDQGKVSNPISFDESENLPYLQACLKEGMRLHRAGALPLNREVPAPGWKVGGHFVPEGSVIGISVGELHRNKEIYGEDAAIFRPERWLEFAKVEGKLAEVETCYITFGRGSRGCIGKNIAMIEIEKLIPELVQNFDFEVPDWSKFEKKGGGLRTRGWQFAKVISFDSKIKKLSAQ